jgi:hypothetical protein
LRPTELVPGNCYSGVVYADQDLLFPLIQTLVFIGTEEDPETGRLLWAFREPSFSNAAVEGSDPQEVAVVFSEEQLYQILDFDGLIRRLLVTEHSKAATAERLKTGHRVGPRVMVSFLTPGILVFD